MKRGHEDSKVALVSLGCAKNRVDSELMLGELRQSGYRVVEDPEEATTVIVNTCGFIHEAKEESIDTILEAAARKDPDSGQLLVAGCMVNRYGQELAAEIPEIDGFIALDQLREVDRLVQLGGAAPPPGPAHLVFDHSAPRVLTTQGYAYLKVAEGCNNPCTFCAIPSWRGRFRSRTVDSLVAEARDLEAAGISELCLIAQDTTRYGEDIDLGKHGLLQLVERLLAETSIPWIRFLYAYPTTLDMELLAAIGLEDRLVPYLDIPFQHSHPEILRGMRRGGSGTTYLRLVERARELVPDLWLRSTFIVGFPGESEERFEDLLSFVSEARFDHLGAFAFSPEPGTPAAEMSEEAVPAPTVRRRHERLLATQRPISLAARQRLVGTTVETLVTGVCEETEHLLEGRHAGMAPEIDGRLLINDGLAPPGALVEVEVTDAWADDLVGRIVGPTDLPGVEPAPADAGRTA